MAAFSKDAFKVASFSPGAFSIVAFDITIYNIGVITQSMTPFNTVIFGEVITPPAVRELVTINKLSTLTTINICKG